MIVDIDYGTTRPRVFQLNDNGAAFDGTGFAVALELLQIGGLVWHASTAYVVGDLVRPTEGNGRLYRVTVAGTSDVTEPTFPTVAGGTVVDGTVTFEEMTPAVDWLSPAGGTVEVTGLEELPRDSSFRARYVVTDNFGESSPFPNKNRVDTWRVGAPMAG